MTSITSSSLLQSVRDPSIFADVPSEEAPVASTAAHAAPERQLVEWLARALGRDVCAVRRSSHVKHGGLSGSFHFLRVELGASGVGGCDDDEASRAPKAIRDAALSSLELAVKVVPEAALSRSVGLGCAREGLFYRHLGPSLEVAGVPRAYAAAGLMETGESVVCMDCLSGAVPIGVFFGPGNPNNWGASAEDVMRTVGGIIGGPHAHEWDATTLSAEAFRLYARLHGAHWGEAASLGARMPWLRGAAWAVGDGGHDGEATWQRAMGMAADAWAALSAARREENSVIEWDAHLVACLDVSFSKAGDYAAFLSEQSGRPLTLVHGDCHPHNVLLAAAEAAPSAARPGESKGCEDGGEVTGRECWLRLIDFEMVGLGSGAQELGQFLISHTEPALRRATERELVRAYYDELRSVLCARGLAADANAYTFEACWEEYVAGGAGRWAWFVAYLVHAKSDSPKLGQYFHDQLAAFLRDHVSDPLLTPMPRV